jgi:hypothetical protein
MAPSKDGTALNLPNWTSVLKSGSRSVYVAYRVVDLPTVESGVPLM